jgi:uncharacterized membrane protein HdeD (DUF308 family)
MSSSLSPLSSNSPSAALTEFGHELGNVRNHWWWFLLLGILMVVLGTISLAAAPFVSVAATIMFGFLLLAAGVVQIVSSFWAGRWSGLLLQLMIGILYAITGFLIVENPIEGVENLTLLVALFLLAAGIFRIVASLMIQFHDWGWVLLNGFITMLLGLMILKKWPSSGFWVIGMFVGIDMIFNGWAWIMLSIGLRSIKIRHSAAAK